MNGLKPIKMPSAKEKVAAELRKAILSRQMKEGEVLSLESVATQLNVSAMPNIIGLVLNVALIHIPHLVLVCKKHLD